MRERKGPVAKRWEGEGACAAIRCDSPLKLIEQCGSLRFVSFVAAVFVGPTVLLEAEWALRAAYGFSPRDIQRFFRALLGLPGLTTDEPSRMARGLDAYEAGFDFADALHLAFAGVSDAFATFDARLARRARRRGGMKVVAP